MIVNNSLYFNRYYYDGLPDGFQSDKQNYYGIIAESNVGDRNAVLTAQRYRQSGRKLDLCDSHQSFQLVTQYPGLLVGTGYPHEIPIPGALKMGCSFDNTTGLPTIPGSSIKGLLRSYVKDYWDLVKTTINLSDQITSKDFIVELFENSDVAFLDAWPIAPGKDGRLFGVESITPHTVPSNFTPSHGLSRSDYEGLTEPKPLQTLKVIPGVTYVFRFLLPEPVAGVSQRALLDSFKELITSLGAGAKTSVSFGVFTERDTSIDDPRILEAFST